jgi:thiol-disulfide isomerase/thioredoxin
MRPVRTSVLTLVLLLVPASVAGVRAASAPLTATTGDEFVERVHGWKLVTGDDYRDIGRTLETRGFRPLDPGAYPDAARFAIVPLGLGRHGSAVLVERQDGGFRLHVDFDADGSTDGEPPLSFPADDFAFTATAGGVLQGTIDGTEVEAPATLRLRLDPDGAFLMEDLFFRRPGTIRVGEREIVFAIEATRRIYRWPEVCLDIDGDGTLGGGECLPPDKRRVELDGRTYEITVGEGGSTLSLTAVDAAVPAAAAVETPDRAPAFEFRDLDGTPGTLVSYRGQVVLLDFWATWCSPCVADAPKLAALHRRYADRGLVILGIDVDDDAPTSRGFADEHGLPWRQIAATMNGPIMRLFEVRRLPTYILVGRDGEILGRPRRGDVVAAVERAMAGVGP